MLTVDDIMTRDVLTFEADTPLREAIAELLARKMGGAAVVDRGRVVGVLSRTDVLALNDDPRVGLTVEDVMTPLVHYVRVGDPAMSAIRMMLTERIHRVMVIQGHGRLAGIITTTDVLKAIDRGHGFALGDAAG